MGYVRESVQGKAEAVSKSLSLPNLATRVVVGLLVATVVLAIRSDSVQEHQVLQVITELPDVATSGSTDAEWPLWARQLVKTEDTIAQWLTVIISSVATVVSFVAICLVYATLRETRLTTRAAIRSTAQAREANRIMRDDQRPWLVLTDAKFMTWCPMQYADDADKPADYTQYMAIPQFSVENFGRQPAQNVKWVIGCVSRFKECEKVPFHVNLTSDGDKTFAEVGARDFLETDEKKVGLRFSQQITLGPGQRHMLKSPRPSPAYFITPSVGCVKPEDKKVIVIVAQYTGLDKAIQFETVSVYEIVVITELGEREDLHPEVVGLYPFGLRQISSNLR